jgi:hypothetical protein
MSDWDSAFADLDRAVFPILAGVCPYEDTVFNSWQVPNLLAEPERLPADRVGPWVPQIRELCMTAGQEPHRYVWLVGD